MLAVNVLEAAATDAESGEFAKAMCGCMLVWLRASQLRFSGEQGLFNTWNAAFCYDAGFAWSFSLIGITPLVVACVLGDWNTWLAPASAQAWHPRRTRTAMSSDAGLE